MELVEAAHQAEVLGAFPSRLIIEPAAIQAQELALAAHRERLIQTDQSAARL